NLRVLIEHGFARDRKKCSARGNHTLRFSATKPDPAPIIEVTQVAHAVKNAAGLRIVDFRMGGGVWPMKVLFGHHPAADHDLTDLPGQHDQIIRPSRNGFVANANDLAGDAAHGSAHADPASASSRDLRFAQDFITADGAYRERFR